MSTFEQRKAEALESVMYWMERAVDFPNKSHEYFQSALDVMNGHFSIIRELLQPAPSEQEVDEAVAECKDLLNKNELVALMVARVYLETLIRAAQKPRREWLDISSSPKYPMTHHQSPHFLAICADGYVHECWWDYPREGSIAYAENHPPQICRVIEAGAIGVITEHPKLWMDLPPLPEPPKVTR